MAFAKRSIGGHNAKAQNKADKVYDRYLEKLENLLDTTSDDDGHQALILAQRLEALVDNGVIAALLTNGSVSLPAATPANAPLALGVGSLAPVAPVAPAVLAPAAPVVPAAPSPEEIIGQKFVAALPTADIDTVLGFLEEVSRTGLDYNRSLRTLQAIGAASNANQTIEFIEQLVHGADTLITDPTTRVVGLKSLNDVRAREAQWKDIVLEIASAIAGTTVTIGASGTRTVIQAAIDAATKNREERIELVDAIHSEFGVTLSGSMTMAAYVTAAKAAISGTTAPIPTVPTSGIDLLAEIDRDTDLKKSGARDDRDYANRVKQFVKEALATQELCHQTAGINAMVGVRPDMRLLDITHALLTVMAKRRMTGALTVPAKPTI